MKRRKSNGREVEYFWITLQNTYLDVQSIYSLMYHICIYVNRLMNEEDVIRPMVRNHKYASLFKDPKHDSE